MKVLCDKMAQKDGVALLLTLLFVVLLTALVVEFAYETQVETAQVTANVNDFDAMIAARSAVNTGMSLLLVDMVQNQMQKTGQLQQSNSQQNLPPGQGLQYDSLDEAWALGTPFQPINDKAVMQCSISDEYGKLNVNALYDWRSNQERGPVVEVLRRLLEDRGADPGLMDAILDWLDSDNDPRPQGAENDYYQSLPIPYSAKNGPLSSIEELLMIRGVTPDLYFGDPSKGQLPLSELLTVCQPYSRWKININTAPHELLVAIGETLGQSGLAETIEQERQSSPFVSVQDIQARGIQVTQPPQQAGVTMTQPFLVRSGAFRIQGNGMAGESKVRIEAFVRRDIQGGPDGFRLLSWKEIR